MISRLRIKAQACLTMFSVHAKLMLTVGRFIILIAFISLSCGKRPPEGNDAQLSISAQNASTNVSMSIPTNELGKFALNNKFIAVLPRALGSSHAQEIDLYVVDAPTFALADFTVDKIKQQGLTAKRMTSLEQLAGELNGAKLGFDNFILGRKVETDVDKKGRMTVTDLDTKTKVTCTCPCSVTFGDDKVAHSCT